MKKKVACSIAGSDSSAGAGIQADLKSFSYLGVHGVTAITCITAQNTQQIRTICKVPANIIDQQIESIFDDFPITAVKTGMLYDRETVKIVTHQLRKYHTKPIVDPVMIATSGDLLSNQTFIASLKQELLPHTLMVTANIQEASILTRMKIIKERDVEKACNTIFKLGPKYVLLKGGHLPGNNVTDLFYDGKKYHRFTLPRIPKKKAHGSGCTLSALITGFLALGESPLRAVEKAKSIVWSMIKNGYSPGKGADVLNHSSAIQVPPIIQKNEQFDIWLQLKTAVEILVSILPPKLIPEVGINFAFSCTNAKTQNDVCAIDGRIVKHKERPALFGNLDFGASKHIAAIVLSAMSFDPTIRSAMNIRYTQETLELCRNIGFTLGSFDRAYEPKTTSSTMKWGIKQTIITCRKVPDIIYDIGALGKEPMIRILGKNPRDVLYKIKKLVNANI